MLRYFSIIPFELLIGLHVISMGKLIKYDTEQAQK